MMLLILWLNLFLPKPNAANVNSIEPIYYVYNGNIKPQPVGLTEVSVKDIHCEFGSMQLNISEKNRVQLTVKLLYLTTINRWTL